MVDAVKMVYGIVVLVVVSVYSVFVLRSMGSYLGTYLHTQLQSELESNPHMLKDYEIYKVEMKKQEEKERQMKELEEQANKIKQQMEELKRPKTKYVEVEGWSDVETQDGIDMSGGHQTTSAMELDDEHEEF